MIPTSTEFESVGGGRARRIEEGEEMYMEESKGQLIQTRQI